MSLKGVHVLFIVLSIALALLMAVWALGQYTSGQGNSEHLLAAIFSVAAAAGLAAYARRFLRKARQIGLE